jgi:hypothetical protein
MVFPVRVNFNSSKYTGKKPLPSNNNHVSIHGFLENINTDRGRFATVFHVSVDNIIYQEKAAVTTPPTPKADTNHTHMTV